MSTAVKRLYAAISIVFCFLALPSIAQTECFPAIADVRLGHTAIDSAKADVDSGKAIVKFASSTYDFGSIYEKDGPVSCEFVFKNIGTSSLTIISVKSGCKCTIASFPRSPIMPGCSDKILVTFDPTGRLGELYRTIKVLTNAANPKQTIKIVGLVVPGNR